MEICFSQQLKDDNEEYRVMYQPGPHGTPLHTLLVEGYVDGPLDTCLCISWESTLYKKWWPQISFPPFKITNCKCLQKVQIGEQISLVRVKVTWPLSAREAVVHYFLFEYLKDGLVVVLLNTISDLESVDKTTHGFTRDGIPEVKDVVRIDVVGGFAIQKVTKDRSYFRTIATVDLKLDFVPPSLINFISRQLVGSGFKLYQKAVASVSTHDEDYRKALEDPMYARIRESLYSTDETNGTTEGKELENDACLPLQEHSPKDMEKNLEDMKPKVTGGEGASESMLENAQVTDKKIFCEIEEDESEELIQLKDEIDDTELKVHSNGSVTEILQNITVTTDRKAFDEIEEEESDVSVEVENCGESIGPPLTDKFVTKSLGNCKRNILVSPEVEEALETLEKAISLVRECGFNSPGKFSPGVISDNSPNLQKGAEKDSPLADDRVSSDSEVSAEVSEKVTAVERTSHESRNKSSNRDVSRRVGSNSYTREVNHNKIAPASPEQYLPIATESIQVLRTSKDVNADLPITDRTLRNEKQMDIEVNGIHENVLQVEKKSSWRRKHRLCCFSPSRP
ncbi:uncharacterized protein LOC110622327 isoform X3 [Manihot esculenta]|uniref:START domain-containing protein n=2 Tax=Manihot esculenta TaxID=3983 RepID=A0A251KJG3_MANES|nr:uncharacterized protein LOC110622327 isoform X3 [Manihot esculenta]KAG8646934.1 hypothetical protein MANES_09G043100v8 [Manihot esculenta]OAY40709.1 hypothetical protein MANES_09G043100v8 [Manihot esculenta]OAY40714.1 hypothetical protein MANES_09G043100v8 [Manihot esculenta]